MAEQLFTLIQTKKFRCDLCPMQCVLSPGEVGYCIARSANEEGIGLEYYGQILAAAVEPIEKKPIYHYCPGSKVLSVGFGGCQLFCNYCENFKISQEKKWTQKKQFSPSGLINLAVNKKCAGICFTYNEPTIHYEFIRDVAEKAKRFDLYICLKTNGFVSKIVWEKICNFTDVMNIDWKGPLSLYKSICNWSDEKAESYYKRIIENIVYAASQIRVELSVPILDTDILKYESIDVFLKDREIPLHLLKVFPANRFSEQTMPDNLILELREKLLQSYRFVFAENIFGEIGIKSRSSICPSCGTVLIERNADTVKIFEPMCDICKNLLLRIGSIDE